MNITKKEIAVQIGMFERNKPKVDEVEIVGFYTYTVCSGLDSPTARQAMKARRS